MKLKLFLSPKITSSSLSNNVFCFVADKLATKKQIASFVETHYATEVQSVNALVRDGKTKKKGRFLYKKKVKKFAYVTIKKGSNTSLLMQEMAKSFMQKYGLNQTLNSSNYNSDDPMIDSSGGSDSDIQNTQDDSDHNQEAIND